MKNVLHFDRSRTSRPQFHEQSTIIQVNFQTRMVMKVTDLDNVNKTQKTHTTKTARVQQLNRKIAA